MKLDKSSPVPLYHQLKEKLIQLIESKYEPNSLLPTESEFERMFGVSRMTVRLAMNALVEEGLVVRQQGRGTFVQSPKITHSLTSVTSWTQQMKERGFTPQTVKTELDLAAPPRKIAQMLGISGDERVVRLKRLRYANDEPMCIMINYLVEKRVPGFVEGGFQEESLYRYLEREYRLSIAEAHENVEAREASEHEAEELKIAPYSPVLFVTRLSFLPDRTPFEVVYLTSRADRYQYQIILQSQGGDR